MISLSTTSADNIAQQILSTTSLYLLRLVDDIYNRPAATNPERFSLILLEYLKTAMAIMARFFSTFGIGGFRYWVFVLLIIGYLDINIINNKKAFE
jgi:hypothetical protein